VAAGPAAREEDADRADRAAAARERPRDDQAGRAGGAHLARRDPRPRGGSGAPRRRDPPRPRARRVLILCVVDGDPLSLEALTFASRLGDVEALIFGEADVDGYVARAWRVVHDRLDEYAPDAWAQTIVELEPDVVVAPGTDRGHEVLARVAARIGVPLAANVVDAEADGDALLLTRQRWGGSLLEEARLTGTPKLLTVAPHAIDAQPAGLTTTVE